MQMFGGAFGGPAKVGYTPDDPRFRRLQQAGSSDTILSPPGVSSGAKFG